MYIKNSTKEFYQIALNKISHSIGGKNPFEYFSGKDPENISKEIDSIVNKMDLSDTTKITTLSAIRSIISDELEISLPKSKLAQLLSPRRLRESPKEVLEVEEVDKLINYFTELVAITKNQGRQQVYFRNLRNLVIIKLLAGTSQRISDILNLKVTDAKKPKIHFKQEKTGAEVNIENPCLPEILLYTTLLSLRENDFLFKSGIYGKRLDRSSVNKFLGVCYKVIGKHISPHCFRKYVAQRLSALGYSTEEIQSITGHSDLSMVQYYTGRKKTIEGTKNILISPINKLAAK